MDSKLSIRGSIASQTSPVPTTLVSGFDDSVLQIADPLNTFGFHFLAQLNETEEDRTTVFSPLSLMMTLGVLYEASEGETKQQILETEALSSIGSNSELIRKINKEILTHYEMVKTGKIERNFDLFIGNLLLLNKLIKFNPDFESRLMEHYLTSIELVNFAHGENKVREKINEWIAEVSNNKFSDFTLNTSPNSRSLILFANIVYFKGLWVDTFDPRRTQYDYFTNIDKTHSRVKFMYRRWDLNVKFARIDEHDLKIISLPFKDNLSLIIIMPNKIDALPELIEKMNITLFNKLIGCLKETTLDSIGLPKIKLTDEISLDDVLPYLGVSLPFSGEAQLEGISSYHGTLKVTECFHKTQIEIDEGVSGKKLAKTMMIGVHRAKPSQSKRFRANKPFLFAVRDELSGINIMLGQIVRLPNSKSYRPRFMNSVT